MVHKIVVNCSNHTDNSRNQKKLVNSNAEKAAKNIELFIMLIEQTEKTCVTSENAPGQNVSKLVSGVDMIDLDRGVENRIGIRDSLSYLCLW